MKPSQAIKVLQSAFALGYPVMLKGAPGVGKTDIVTEAAKQAGAELIISHPVVSDPTDYKGLPAKVGDKAVFLLFPELEQVIDAKKRTIFFFDDIGQAPQTVQAACMQWILARRASGRPISNYVTFCAATNRRQDRAGVTGILEPVKSRFAAILDIVPDVDDFSAWAQGHDVSAETIAFTRFRPEMLCAFTPTPDISNTPCPRTIVNADKWYKLHRDGVLDEYSAKQCIAGAAGEGYATEFIAFTGVFKSLPKLSEIIKSPETVDVPSKIDVRFALLALLTRKVTEETFSPLIKYISRFGKEFVCVFVRDAVAFNAELTKTQAYTVWALNNQDVLI